MKQSKAFYVGLSGVAILLGFVWFYQFLQGKNLLNKQYYYSAYFADVSGLEKSKPVNINGFKAGTIEDIIPIQQGDSIVFEVKFTVNSPFSVYQNTIGSIENASLLGGKILNLTTNPKNKGKKLSHGAKIQSQIKQNFLSQLENRLDPTQAKLNQALGSLDQTLVLSHQVLNQTNRDNLEKSIANLNLVLQNLNQTRAEIENTSKAFTSLAKDNNPKITEVLNQSKLTLKQGETSLASTEKNLDTTLDNLDKTLLELNGFIQALNQSEGTLGKLVNSDELHVNLNKTLLNLQNLTQDLKENPEKYVQLSLIGGKKSKKEKKQQ
ncbi:MAG: hypothetical protein C4K58_07685 [Flavobacteriaceae bacterium]|nr:MAG: hypothetical protein C4K58_07685 [Flavobacteriaceae bacterium]